MHIAGFLLSWMLPMFTFPLVYLACKQLESSQGNWPNAIRYHLSCTFSYANLFHHRLLQALLDCLLQLVKNTS